MCRILCFLFEKKKKLPSPEFNPLFHFTYVWVFKLQHILILSDIKTPNTIDDVIGSKKNDWHNLFLFTFFSFKKKEEKKINIDRTSSSSVLVTTFNKCSFFALPFSWQLIFCALCRNKWPIMTSWPKLFIYLISWKTFWNSRFYYFDQVKVCFL